MKRSVLNYAGFLSVFLVVLFLIACPVSAGNEDVLYTTGFEGGLGDWSTDNGLWEVGASAAGVAGCYEGAQCAGTRTGPTAGRLISPPVVLPSVAGDEEIHLSFHHWFSYGPDFQGSGTIEISSFNFENDEWSQWEPLGDSFVGESTAWSPAEVDLTAYCGKPVRVAFKSDSGKRDDAGWHVDAVEIWKSGNSFALKAATAVKPVVSSFKINNGAATTTKRKVILNNTATGVPTVYMASESSTFTGATWKTYSKNPSFTLSAGPGYKTVYFKVRNAAGVSTVVKDTIELTDPLGGTWNGGWKSDHGSSGPLKVVVTQTASGYAGKLTITNPLCGTLLNLPATITLSGNIVKCVVWTSCVGINIKMQLTQGILSGNTINGPYIVYGNGDPFDTGTFILNK
jgi:hypothetical protein